MNETTGKVTFIAAGTCTIASQITTDGTYASASSASISFQITLVTRTLTIDPNSYDNAYTMANTPPTIVAIPSAGTGVITFQNPTHNICEAELTSGVVDFHETGICELGATIASDGIYAEAVAQNISFTISLAPRTIHIDAGSYDASYKTSDPPPTLVSIVSAGSGTREFIPLTHEICLVDPITGVVTFLAPGTCSIEARIVSDGVYENAESTPISFTLQAPNRTLTIDADSYQSSYSRVGEPPILTSTASAGGGVKSYTTDTPNVCVVEEFTGKVRFLSEGTCTITASIASDGTYDIATSNTIAFQILFAAGRRVIPPEPPAPPQENEPPQEPNTTPAAPEIKPENPPAPITPTTPPAPIAPPTPIATNEASGTTESVKTTEPAAEKNVAKTEYVPEVCEEYLKGFIKLGAANDPAEVRKLQDFLRTHEGEMLITDGIYKESDVMAVKRFQVKYGETLTYWGMTQPTGYVYITTRRTINRLYCKGSKQTICPYFITYQKVGDRGTEMQKIKSFLNNTQGESLDTGSDAFDADLAAAVRRFQVKFAERVLLPWGMKKPSGWWYQSTMKVANDLLGCFAPVKLDNGKVLE